MNQNDLARFIMSMFGMSQQQITNESAVNRLSPRPGVQAPAPGSIVPQGQANMFTKSGKLRDFTNPAVARTRPATLTPVQPNNPLTLNPGPVRPPAPGQMSIFGTNPGATVTARDLLQAPSIPPEGSATKPNPRSNPFLQTPSVQSGVGTKPQFKPNLLTRSLRRLDNVSRNTYNRAVGVANKPGLGKGGYATIGLGLADVVQDIILQRYFPETYELKQANKIGGSDATMSTTREDIRAQREALANAQQQLTQIVEPAADETVSKKKVDPVAPLQLTTVDNPTPVKVPRSQVTPPVQATPQPTPVAPKESAYGASGKDLYMKAKGRNPLMIKYFGESYATDKKKKFT